MLAYPNFDVDFVLETDALVKGLGAVVSSTRVMLFCTQCLLQVVRCLLQREIMV